LKKSLLIGVPLLLFLVGGTTVGLSMLGIVSVPFLPFGKKKLPHPVVDDGKGGPMARTFLMVSAVGKTLGDEAARAARIKVPAAPQAAVDTGPGEAKLAGLWGEMPTDRLVSIIEKWPEPELGRILTKMDEEALTKLLAAMPADRAARLSQLIAAETDKRAAKVRET
jgi:hypothetical protein